MNNKKIDSLINECRKFIPLDGRVLVYALKLKQVKQADYSFDLDRDSKANQGKDPEKHRVDLIKVQPKVNAKYQGAIILQVPLDETRFTVGDHIVYPIGAINQFDYVKGVSILRKYDIAAVIIEEGVVYETDDKKIFELGTPVMAGYNMA
jgi:hypothetical protein